MSEPRTSRQIFPREYRRAFFISIALISGLTLVTSCGLIGSKKEVVTASADQPLFNARDIKFFELSPSPVRVTALPNQLDSLAIGNLQRIQSNFTGNGPTLPKTNKTKTFGEIGEAVGAPGAKAYDLFRVHLGVHDKYSTHFCQDLGYFRKLSIQERDLRLPGKSTFSLDWPTRSHDDGHTFVAAEKLNTGESQWRLVHYAAKTFNDAFVFRFNPITNVLRQIVILKDQSFWLVDMPMIYTEATGYIRDQKKPLRVKANFKWMRSEFDVAIQGGRVLGDWRQLNKEETKVDWTRVNMIGRWGTFSFRPKEPAFIAREIGLIDSEGSKSASVYDLETASFIRYESNSALRSLTAPKPEPKKLTYTDWGTALDLISAITVEEKISKTVEPKVMVAMTESPESPCIPQGRVALPIEFYSGTPEFRKTFNLPDPTPVPTPEPEAPKVDTSTAPVITDSPL